MVYIKSLSSASLAKVFGIMYLILGLIFSPFIILAGSAEGGASGFADSILFIVIFVLIYGIGGIIGGFITGVLYNFVAENSAELKWKSNLSESF